MSLDYLEESHEFDETYYANKRLRIETPHYLISRKLAAFLCVPTYIPVYRSKAIFLLSKRLSNTGFAKDEDTLQILKLMEKEDAFSKKLQRRASCPNLHLQGYRVIEDV